MILGIFELYFVHFFGNSLLWFLFLFYIFIICFIIVYLTWEIFFYNLLFCRYFRHLISLMSWIPNTNIWNVGLILMSFLDCGSFLRTDCTCKNICHILRTFWWKSLIAFGFKSLICKLIIFESFIICEIQIFLTLVWLEIFKWRVWNLNYFILANIVYYLRLLSFVWEFHLFVFIQIMIFI